MTEAQAIHALQKLTDKALTELASHDKRFLASEVRTQCLQGTIGSIFGLAIGFLATEGRVLHSGLPEFAIDAGKFILWTSQLVLATSLLYACWPPPLIRAKIEHCVLCRQPRLYPAYRRIAIKRLCGFALFFMAYTVLGQWLIG